jgi:hypothetical protein
VTREGRRFDESPFAVGATTAGAGVAGYSAYDIIRRNREFTETLKEPRLGDHALGHEENKLKEFKNKPLKDRAMRRAVDIPKESAKALFKNPIKDRTWTSAKTLPKGNRALGAIGASALVAGGAVAASNQGRKAASKVIHKSAFGIIHDAVSKKQLPSVEGGYDAWKAGYDERQADFDTKMKNPDPAEAKRAAESRKFWADTKVERTANRAAHAKFVAGRVKGTKALAGIAAAGAGTAVVGGAFALHRGDAKYENAKRRKIKQNPKWKALP